MEEIIFFTYVCVVQMFFLSLFFVPYHVCGTHTSCPVSLSFSA
jgi:hypothetical protein